MVILLLVSIFFLDHTSQNNGMWLLGALEKLQPLSRTNKKCSTLFNRESLQAIYTFFKWFTISTNRVAQFVYLKICFQTKFSCIQSFI